MSYRGVDLLLEIKKACICYSVIVNYISAGVECALLEAEEISPQLHRKRRTQGEH